MKILITGSNGNLGRCLVKELANPANLIYEASSKPKAKQININFESMENFKIPKVDLVIHCARSFSSLGLSREIKFLDTIFKQNAKVVNIGSLSESLIKPNNYGLRKSVISKHILNKGGTVLTCGLLVGKDYKGQIWHLQKYLRYTPFYFKIKQNPYQYFTCLECLIKILIDYVLVLKNENYAMFEREKIVDFNVFLKSISLIKLTSLTIDLKKISSILNVLKLKFGNYFSADSILGLLGNLDKENLYQLNYEIYQKLNRCQHGSLFYEQGKA